MSSFIKGIYWDTLTNGQGRVVWQSGQRPNLIVQNCSKLNAALMKGHPGMHGILYWAVGTGQKIWDANPPQPSITTTQLENEVYRLPISEDRIVYLDDTGAPTDSPCNRLEVTAEFNGTDIAPDQPQKLREFGLFGGDAAEEPDTGFMIDYVIHPRIDLHRGLTLIRKLQFNFAEPPAGPTGTSVEQERIIGYGAALPIKSIDGIGDKWTDLLHENRIQTLDDLAKIDPLVPIGNIPKIMLIEFCTKARMVMNLNIDLTYFHPLDNLSISDILLTNPEELLNQIGSPEVTREGVTAFQHRLAVLQVALDDAALKDIPLKDLIP
jgi:hypothetical protein